MNSPFYLEILHQDSRGLARVGKIYTPHGVIDTPALVPVGTKASVKSLTNEEVEKLGYRLFFVNTYHMLVSPGTELIKRSGGIHKFMNWNHPLITDSGGFQVFSLDAIILKKNENGVVFRDHYAGNKVELTPEFSIQTQRTLGADIMIPLDECTSYPITHEKAKKSLELTKIWFKKSFEEYKRTQSITGSHQALYRIIQGSVYDDLRVDSIEFYKKENIETDGWAIGGVSVGETKDEIRHITELCMKMIAETKKPVHLLGVGEVDDIMDIINSGVDTFDCVQPTRLARMGVFYNLGTSPYTLDISKADFKDDFSPLDGNCDCYACAHHTRAYLHHLFKMKELTVYRLLSLHNLALMQSLVKKCRIAIANGVWSELFNKYKNGELVNLHKITD